MPKLLPCYYFYPDNKNSSVLSGRRDCLTLKSLHCQFFLYTNLYNKKPIEIHAGRNAGVIIIKINDYCNLPHVR